MLYRIRAFAAKESIGHHTGRSPLPAIRSLRPEGQGSGNIAGGLVTFHGARRPHLVLECTESHFRLHSPAQRCYFDGGFAFSWLQVHGPTTPTCLTTEVREIRSIPPYDSCPLKCRLVRTVRPGASLSKTRNVKPVSGRETIKRASANDPR